MYRSRDNMFSHRDRKAFTLLELVAALTILAIVTSSVMVVMSQCIETTIDNRNRALAFRIARDNMENLLTLPSVEESVDFGEYEPNPDIQWETIIEIVDHPQDSKMWVQAVCSASYTDNTGERQYIDLTHWLTDLSTTQQRQILDQKKREKDFMEEFDENPFGDDAEGMMKYANALAASNEFERAIDVAWELIIAYPDSPEADKIKIKIIPWEDGMGGGWAWGGGTRGGSNNGSGGSDLSSGGNQSDGGNTHNNNGKPKKPIEDLFRDHPFDKLLKLSSDELAKLLSEYE